MTGQPTAVIVCPGPSLADWPGLGAARARTAVIAVNRAAAAVAADWWCWTDPHVAERVEAIGSPACFTTAAARARVTAARPQWAARTDWLDHDPTFTTCPRKPAWWNFTAMTAVVLAEHLGLTDVLMVGADWAGTADWDGPSPLPCYRAPGRWGRERHTTGHVMRWAAGRGLTVRRRLADGTHETLADGARTAPSEALA